MEKGGIYTPKVDFLEDKVVDYLEVSDDGGLLYTFCDQYLS